MGWLTDLTNWLREQIQALWDAIESFFTELLIEALETGTTVVLWIVNAIPMPDWLVNTSLCNLLGSAGPEVGFFLQTFRIAEGLSLIAAGYVFRLTRKLLTAGQW